MENNIMLGDCREKLKLIDNNSIDLILTSPPYDNLRNYNNPKSDWSFEVFKAIAEQLERVLKMGGVSMGCKRQDRKL